MRWVFSQSDHEPDVIVADWMMPYLDGVTLCQRLRSARTRIPILILTARTELSDRVTALDAGADDFLAKPFALDELLARLRALVRQSLTVCTPTMLYDMVWGYDFGPESKTLPVFANGSHSSALA